jgi:hypothetical protein
MMIFLYLKTKLHHQQDFIKTSCLMTINLSLLFNKSKPVRRLAGPFADSPELFRAFALTPSQQYGPNKEITYPNLPLAHSFINILHNAELPDDILPAFYASYFLALHKEVGLQPILIGTSLKCILGTMESSAFVSDFASYLAPFQYGIALPEGMQFLTMAIRNLVHDLLPGGSDSTSASHVLLFFDIANIFNLVSQKSS